MSKKNIGSSFDDFLKEESILESSTAIALKRVIAWQIAKEMKAQNLTKTELAKRMHTSRAALNRLLDEHDASLTLTTLASAAAALGRRAAAPRKRPTSHARRRSARPSLAQSQTCAHKASARGSG